MCFFTEFTNSDSYCHPEGKIVYAGASFLQKMNSRWWHIFGDKPEFFREMSIGVAEMGFQGNDINMGCPVPNVAERGKRQRANFAPRSRG